MTARRERVAGLLARISQAHTDMVEAADELALLAQLGEASGAGEYEAALAAYRATIKSQSDDLAAAWRERDAAIARAADLAEGARLRGEKLEAVFAERNDFAARLVAAEDTIATLRREADEARLRAANAPEEPKKRKPATFARAATQAPAVPLPPDPTAATLSDAPPARPQPRRAHSKPACASCRFATRNAHAHNGWACSNRANECVPDVFNYRYEPHPSQPAR